MAKKEKTESQETENPSYSPVYITLNATNNPYLVGYTIEKAFEEASEYNSPVYLTINSGNPPNPPICPPGMVCDP